MKATAVLLGVLLLLPATALAHKGLPFIGKLDQHGCHKDWQLYKYVCHEGVFKGRMFRDKDEMLAALKHLPDDKNAPPSAMPRDVVPLR